MAQRQWIKDLREMSPRVHCITNYVTAGDVANLVLAAGGSPIMAQGINEVEDVTSICASLVLNMGTLEEKTIPSMEAAGRKAVSMGHPVILDPVGVTASEFRRKAASRLICQVMPSVIRGNEAEICTLEQALSGQETGNTGGVDSGSFKTLERRMEAAGSLGKQTGAVVVMTGKEDIIIGNKCKFIVRNGHPWMARITGSGCMLDGLMGAFCALSSEKYQTASLEEAAAIAVSAHGLCGEMAYKKTLEHGGGTGMFRMYLMDAMSCLDDRILEGGKNIEIR